MALTPSNSVTPTDKKKVREAAAEDVLLREVDEAVRQDEMSDIFRKYGKPVMAAIALGLVGFAGYLFWDNRQEADLEKQSEAMISALDQLEAGNLQTGAAALDPVIADGSDGARSVALMMKAGILQEQGKADEAAKLFAQVAADGDAPQTLRDLATVREIAATYDRRKPDEIVGRLKSLAVPGNAYFGSAGEMVAMAYLDQGKTKEAGALFAQIAKAEDVPEGLRSRTRRMAGLLGVDAIEDVDEVLEETTGARDPAAAPAPAQ